jgi:hypothetical protein
MEGEMQTSLEQAVAYIKAGDITKARALLIEYLKQNIRDENAWLWMTKCVSETEQKRYCFEKVLKINPQNQHAINGLRRLDHPVSPVPQPKPDLAPQKPASLNNQQSEAKQQLLPPRKSEKGNSPIVAFAIIVVIAFACVVVTAVFTSSSYSSKKNNLQQQSNPLPTTPISTTISRPNYRQMLETNGFEYQMDDEDGYPIYLSFCGCVATVKPEYIGFAVYAEDECAVQELGAITSVMYPSEVSDFILDKIDEVVMLDTSVRGKAVGHNIVMHFDQYDYKLRIVIDNAP